MYIDIGCNSRGKYHRDRIYSNILIYKGISIHYILHIHKGYRLIHS